MQRRSECIEALAKIRTLTRKETEELLNIQLDETCRKLVLKAFVETRNLSYLQFRIGLGANTHMRVGSLSDESRGRSSVCSDEPETLLKRLIGVLAHQPLSGHSSLEG